MGILSRLIHIQMIYYLILLCSVTLSDDIELTHTVNNNNIIELNSYYIINQIIFSKVDNNPYNYLLGIFEASNYSTFSDTLPIAIIKEEHVQNYNDIQINIDINVPSPYKYIRYIPPNTNNSEISNIRIFGHAFSDSEDLSQKKLFRPTNLPLMIINTENSKEITSLDYYINSSIIIINKNKMDLNTTAEIRLRGHSTSTRPKKPYKIKFTKKQKLLDIDGKYKKWAILANHYDISLIRNILAFKISEMIGLEFTPRCEPVDVIVNGNFKGNYFVCDQVEVKEGRVDIEEISDNDITGGYLLEIDQRATKEEKYFLTEKGLIGEIKYPDSDDITKEQENYIKKFLNKLEKNVYLGKLKYIDLYSFYRYFIIQEFCGDIDTVLSSFNVHKKKGDNKLYFGPVWDYDLSFDNDPRLIPTNNKRKFAFYYGSSAGSTRDFIITILKTKNVMKEINETWFELREDGLDYETLKNFIYEQKELLLESANLNMLKWYNSKIGQGKEDYSTSVEIVNSYIEQRFDSLTYLIKNYDISDILKINIYILLLFIVIMI